MAKGTNDIQAEAIAKQQSAADELAKPHAKNVKSEIVAGMNDRSQKLRAMQNKNKTKA